MTDAVAIPTDTPPWEVWYQNGSGAWHLFYDHYGTDFTWARDDARKTLGIDIWAIVRNGVVMAASKDASNFGMLISLITPEEYFQNPSDEWLDAYLRMHNIDPVAMAERFKARIEPLLAAYRSEVQA